MNDIDYKKLIEEISSLRTEMKRLTSRYSFSYLFAGGLLHGVGILVGATLLVLFGGTILSLLGLLPGFSEIVEVITNAFEQSRI